MVDLASLQKVLGIAFKDIALLQQSLVHRSYLNENPGFSAGSNERLEFLGDAVLGLVFAHKLYRDFPHFSEGDLTKLRSELVKGETLARLAASLSLGDYLYLGKGEESSGGRRRPRNQARALEALLGAVFLDKGYLGAKRFILKLYRRELKRAASQRARDYKSRIQEVLQSRYQVTPLYRTVEEKGPEHAKVFTVEVLAKGAVIGRGSARSKQSAEKEAARMALKELPAKEGTQP